jgi:hypothetical protein
MTTTQSTPAVAPRQPDRSVGDLDALGLGAELFAEGLRPGVPPHLPARAASIDRQLCRALRCAACRRHGLSYQTCIDGRRSVVLAVCPGCRATMRAPNRCHGGSHEQAHLAGLIPTDFLLPLAIRARAGIRSLPGRLAGAILVYS